MKQDLAKSVHSWVQVHYLEDEVHLMFYFSLSTLRAVLFCEKKRSFISDEFFSFFWMNDHKKLELCFRTGQRWKKYSDLLLK